MVRKCNRGDRDPFSNIFRLSELAGTDHAAAGIAAVGLAEHLQKVSR
jgi:hypothetical protein